MSDQQPKALRLADILSNCMTDPPKALRLADILSNLRAALFTDAAAELRQLHAENDQLREQNTWLDAELAKDTALLRQCLEALEAAYGWRATTPMLDKAIAALRERLENKT